ncbi:hypothetical protein FGO68_gene16257 [Halteria grandinella]|uniref:Uncharacterized protein n=1 Tax=Halteria grandinella TaxID=5974 RepID=A0A8J8NI20_HALGN|nr:hypothetical protein FGO68_gene16257 [Halteria grandinella]
MIQGLNEEAVSLLQKELEKHVDFAQAHYYLCKLLNENQLKDYKGLVKQKKQSNLQILPDNMVWKSMIKLSRQWMLSRIQHQIKQSDIIHINNDYS